MRFMRTTTCLPIAAALLAFAPSASAALPACMTQCAHSCGNLCFTSHACLIRWRNVEPIPNQPGFFLVTCRYRGGYVTTSDGTWFCCNHTIATHDHTGIGTH